MNGFKKFLLRGNVVDLAVAVVIGAAFGRIVAAVVKGLITPLLGLFGERNFDQLTVCLKGPCNGQTPGVQLLYGDVLTELLNFLIVAAVVYFLVVKPVQRLMDRFKTEPEAQAAVKQCPECLSKIPVAASRCAFCTVEQLDGVASGLS
ncbi:MAG: large conductance mechanosensitive channel protein MscL [Frankiales bacterium]|nr:large conductance mechanosensitive channel protein MscL [Frankiales bacterium]